MPGVDVVTGGPTVGWKDDPDGRGTVTLLTSCLLTLALCVWSVMCLDVPPRGSTRIHLWLLYLKWSIIGALGPELMIYVAWRQLNSARTLYAEVQKNLLSPDSNSAEDEKPFRRRRSVTKWSVVHGFYAGMGGFVFDLETGCPRELEGCLPDIRRLTVTPRGAAFLAKCGLLPEISQEEIQDKNKADHLAKTVVCVQALWFLVQTCVRAGQHLNVTLLEINILAHVGCALVVYLLWWNKPSMIQEPTCLVGDWVPSVCAFMYMSSQISVWERDRPGRSRRHWLDSELSALAYVRSNTSTSDSRSQGSGHERDIGTANACAVRDGRLRPRTIVSATTASTQETSPSSKSLERVSNPSSADLKRWMLAVSAIEEHPAIAARLLPVDSKERRSDSHEEEFKFSPEELVTEYASNWPSEHLLRGTGGKLMGMVLWSASMAFGAIHLSAWRDHFPSTIEGWLWRASAMWIAGSGGIWMLINLLAHTIPWIQRLWDDVVAMRVNRMLGGVLVVVSGFCGMAYVVSRSYLFIEAFISIRALPPSAYETPEWTQLIPHF